MQDGAVQVEDSFWVTLLLIYGVVYLSLNVQSAVSQCCYRAGYGCSALLFSAQQQPSAYWHALARAGSGHRWMHTAHGRQADSCWASPEVAAAVPTPSVHCCNSTRPRPCCTDPATGGMREEKLQNNVQFLCTVRYTCTRQP